MLCDLCRKHHETLWFRWSPVVLNAPWKLCSDDLRSRSDKDLPADGNLTAEGCTSSIVVLQVFAPTTPLHFLLSPWCWICLFLPPPSRSGLLVAAEVLFSFPPVKRFWAPSVAEPMCLPSARLTIVVVMLFLHCGKSIICSVHFLDILRSFRTWRR